MTVNLTLAEREVTATRRVFNGKFIMKFFLIIEYIVIPESIYIKKLNLEIFYVLKKCVAARMVVTIYK